jgi:hypothetical protein
VEALRAPESCKLMFCFALCLAVMAFTMYVARVECDRTTTTTTTTTNCFELLQACTHAGVGGKPLCKAMPFALGQSHDAGDSGSRLLL